MVLSSGMSTMGKQANPPSITQMGALRQCLAAKSSPMHQPVHEVVAAVPPLCFDSITIMQDELRS